jgi:glycolate oxidase iron-sulfur subunit
MMTKDISEIIVKEDIEKLRKIIKVSTKKYAFQNPCSLQHGQKIKDETETLLKKLGYQIKNIEDTNQCCGSAGTYSLLQTELSEKLRRKKISTLEAVKPDVIMTANIGCQLHLQQATEIPVKHWIEILEEDIQS